MLERIFENSPDIICLTEGCEDLLPTHGHVVTSHPDYGYKAPPHRRKVVLWSKHAWSHVDATGHGDMPGGRFVSAQTTTPVGPVTFIGVCIPWDRAHVSTGNRNRKPWEDHIAYLHGLSHLFAGTTPSASVMLGDFNQTLPKTRAPQRAYEDLARVLDNKFTAATVGDIPAINRPTLDHVVHSVDLSATVTRGLDDRMSNGKKVSDHFGVFVQLRGSQSCCGT